MKNISRIFVGLCLITGITSCYEDLGNYEYTEQPKIEIIAKDTIYVKQFETLTLPIEVKHDGMSENEVSYEWRIWPNIIGGEDHAKNIATQKDLSYKVTEVPGSYSLVLTCENKNTQVKKYKEITLLVQGVISEGWMVLQEKNGKTDFDLIMSPFFTKRYKEDVILHDLYESVNGETLQGRGIKIGSYFAIGRYQYVTILTEGGGVRLSATTMQKTYDIPTLMLDKKPLKPENYFYFNYYWCFGRGCEVIISDGRFYYNELLGKGFTEPVFKNGETYKAAKFAPKWLWTFKGIIYDELHGRFLAIQDPMLTVNALPSAEGRLFNWNDMKATLKYVDTGFKHWEYALMQDWQTKKYTLYALDFDVKNNFDKAMFSADNCPDLDKALYYAIGDRGNVFFYANSKDIYQYDYAGTNTGKKVYTVKDGEEITNIKIFKPGVDRYITRHPYDNKILVFSTFKSATGEGKVYMYYLNESNGQLELSSEKIFGGFGKILDMDYNFPKYGT